MKKRGRYFFVAIMLSIQLNNYAQLSGDYRSKDDGNWGDVTTWQTYDGSAWIDAVSAPAGATETITIQSGQTVTVASAITINSGCNVVVSGYLKNTAGITATTSVPLSFTFNDGSTYEHGLAGSSIPMSTWNTGSTCLITGITGASPGNALQNYYNFTWNCPSQSASLNLGWDNITIGGNLTVTASGASGGSTYLRMTSAATTRTLTINGNIIVNGGNLTVSGSSGAAQYNVTVKGNIDVSSNSKFSLCAGSGGFGTWYVEGDVSFSETSVFVLPSNKTIGTILIFSKNNGSQFFSYTSSTANANLNYGVQNNSTVTLNTPIMVGSGSNAGNLVLTSGKFISTSANLITLTALGTVTTGTGYVSGPLAATVAAATAKTVTFPIGKSVYRPVVLDLTQDASTSTIYTAELIESAPAANTLPATLEGVSSVRYVHIVKGVGANVSNATIQLSYDTNDGTDVSAKDNIRIAKDDGADAWINLGGSGTADNTGTILSNAFGASTALGTLTTNDFVIAHLNPASVAVVPTLTTNEITYISTTTATGGGVISNDGNAAITAKGVCWGTSATPTLADNFTTDGTTSAPFSSSITGLIAGTLSHVRAYATNSAGTAYGNEVTFTTMSSLAVPTLTTSVVTNIVNTSAKSGGTITEWGGSNITDRGVCWSLSHNPTLADNFNSVGAGGTGAFTTFIGGLVYGKSYYVRAYATNSTGTGYGAEVTFDSPAALPDVDKIVDINGTVGVNCDYTNIQAAFDAVTPGYTGHWFIYVRNGIYYDKVTLAAGKINVVLIGQDKNNTIITYDDYAGNNRTTHGVLSNGTSTSYTCAIDASDFQAQNITFRNTANAYAPSSTAAQAVALRTNGDRQSYYNCRMLGFQDTYYTQGGISGPDRIYNKNCYIEGSVDFIFGRDVVLFDSCTIYCNRQGGVLTAGATEAGYSYGYVFLNSTLGSPAAGELGADEKAMTTFYLGRPWQAAPKTVYINCYEPATVNAAGWTVMGPNPSLYAEYGCTGPGAQSRAVMNVAWPGANQPATLTEQEAATYTIANIFSKNNNGSGFTYAANWIPEKIAIKDSFTPVELVSFRAKTQKGNVMLTWQTASEVNNNGFEIERASISSGAELSWQKIGFVKGNGSTTTAKDYSFTDKPKGGTEFQYRLKQIDFDGTFRYSNVVKASLTNVKTFLLEQNYPNPFNPSTKISYQLAENCLVTLKVYDVLGNGVAVLVNEWQEAGSYNAEFATDTKVFASGMYIYKIHAGDFSQIKKMLLLK